MITIINSIIANKATETVDYLLARQELLSPQEINYIAFLKDSYANSGMFPSVDLVHSTFTELSFKDALGETLSPLTYSDLTVYVYNFLTKREYLHQSQTLMKIATTVSQKGLSDEDMLKIRDLAPQIVSKTSEVDSAQSFRDYYDEKKSKPQGLITNVKAIDEAMGALPYGNTMTIFGFVASYKSMLVNNIVYHNSVNLKYNICIISLEVPKSQVLANLITRHSTLPQFDAFPFISTDKINRSLMTPEEESFVFDTVLLDYFDVKEHGKITILDLTDFTSFSQTEIRTVLEDVDNKCIKETGYPLDAVIVDHINLCKYNGGSSRLSVNEEGNQYVSFFSRLAANFKKLPDGTTQKLMCVLLAQANRTGWKKAAKNKGAYDLTAISEFNELERSSQEIISVFTSDEMKMSKEASVQLLKNRFGPCVNDPQIVYADPQVYTIGDEMAGFAEAIEINELEDVFGGGSVADLL